MGYRENKARSRTLTIGKTMADQSGAEATDINVIVRKMQQSGSFPAGAKTPFYADMSEIPTNLRDMLEMSKNLDAHRSQLPQALQSLSTAELLNTDPKRLSAMITEQDRYTTRREKLPTHFQSMSREAILNLTDEQYTNIITPPAPQAKPPEVK